MSETTQPAVAGPVEPTVRQHTPGPWDWWMAGNGEAMLATPDRGRLYVMQPVRCGMQGGTLRFADWGGGERGRRGGVMRQVAEHCRDGVLMHPDALLIAAAPDLLAALERLLESGDVRDAADAGALKQARTAIAKAVGSAA
jgi:hypothetical protein